MIEIELDQIHGAECAGLGMPTARHLTKQNVRARHPEQLLPNSLPQRGPLASMRTKAAQPSRPEQWQPSAAVLLLQIITMQSLLGDGPRMRRQVGTGRHLLLAAFPQQL